jgi:hypothetical protein
MTIVSHQQVLHRAPNAISDRRRRVTSLTAEVIRCVQHLGLERCHGYRGLESIDFQSLRPMGNGAHVITAQQAVRGAACKQNQSCRKSAGSSSAFHCQTMIFWMP